MIHNIEAIFFDLDGTLLDTAPDLWASLNYVLKKHHKKQTRFDDFRGHVHLGSLGMIQFGFNLDKSHPQYPQILNDFLNHYSENIAAKTRLFPGVKNLINTINKNQATWGIITNKPAWLTARLLPHFDKILNCATVISGDTLEKRKPDPMPLLHACELSNKNPKNSVYIGDTKSDIDAAKAAGMHSIAVSYGYLLNDAPENWQADYIADSADDIGPLLFS